MNIGQNTENLDPQSSWLRKGFVPNKEKFLKYKVKNKILQIKKCFYIEIKVYELQKRFVYIAENF